MERAISHSARMRRQKTTCPSVLWKEYHDQGRHIGEKPSVTGASVVNQYTYSGLANHDNTVNVSTNNPTYDWQHTRLRKYIGLSAVNRETVTIGHQPPLSADADERVFQDFHIMNNFDISKGVTWQVKTKPRINRLTFAFSLTRRNRLRNLLPAFPCRRIGTGRAGGF